MSITRRSSIRDVAAQVSQALTKAGITAVLTGGGAVSIYSENRYQSYDIDFVTAASRRELTAIMSELGFSPGAGRHFVHPATRLVVEFVAWPVTLGEEVGASPNASWGIADSDADPMHQGPACGFLSLAGCPESRAGSPRCQVSPNWHDRVGALVSCRRPCRRL